MTQQTLFSSSGARRSGISSASRTMEKVMVSLPDVEMPAKLAQTLSQIGRLIEHLVNLELPPVVEAAAKHGRFRLRQAMVNRCRSVLVAGIHKKHASPGSEAGTDKLPKIGEPLRRNMGKPKAEKHGVKLPGRLPLEQVRL